MQGRPRKPAKPEELLASAARAEALRALQSQFFSNHHNKVHTDGALQLSGGLIEQNPEFYITWNYRKLVVQQNLNRCSESDPDALKSIIDQELRLVCTHLIIRLWNVEIVFCFVGMKLEFIGLLN
ncbi:hypothetical protein C1H46_043055 [Malus baccata]|uniref:Geranylgeranyl transferase type-2 subunit alpha n=1 Tax=Malus baccata TaxID=106549 RepID=A0A540KAZ7_MALBA|nr:hypothetical protein C1H46_043055 [Malus baccata]